MRVAMPVQLVKLMSLPKPVECRALNKVQEKLVPIMRPKIPRPSTANVVLQRSERS